MDLTIEGLLGAMAGTAIGLTNFVLTVPALQKLLRARDTSKTDAERAEFERKLSVMRRAILGLDVLLFAGLGYWLSSWIFG